MNRLGICFPLPFSQIQQMRKFGTQNFWQWHHFRISKLRGAIPHQHRNSLLVTGVVYSVLIIHSRKFIVCGSTPKDELLGYEFCYSNHITFPLEIRLCLGSNTCRTSFSFQGAIGKLPSMPPPPGWALFSPPLNECSGHKGGLEDQQWPFWARTPVLRLVYVHYLALAKPVHYLNEFIYSSPSINSIHMIILANNSF